jgi:ABC-type nitrate/sulfonate/bicarbonate transport system substrate-binding protein
MKSITKFFQIGLLIVFIVSGCNNQQPQEKKIRVGYLPMVSSLPHFVAVEKGYYKDEGLGVEASPIETSDLIAQDVVAGRIDAGIELSIVPLLKQLESSENSAKIFAISSITSENGFDGIVVKANSPIKNLQDLSGKKIGVFPGTTAKNSLSDVFKASFPQVEMPTFIELDPAVHIQSLDTGGIDALFTYEPTLTTGVINNGFRKISTSIYAMQYSPNPIGARAINNKWLEKNPETAKAFFRAIDKAVEFIRKNPIEAREILTKEPNKLDKRIADSINIIRMSKSTEIDLNNLKGYLDILERMGEIKKAPGPQNICIKQ